MAGLIGTDPSKYSLVGMLGKRLLGRDKRKPSPKKKPVPARKDSDAVYRGNTTPISTLLSGPGRSGY